MKLTAIRLVGVFASLTLLASTANAALIINAIESDGDVLFSTEAGGTLDLNGMTKVGDSVAGGQVNPNGLLFLGAPGSSPIDSYLIASAPGPFGIFGLTNASSGSGDVFGVVTLGGSDAGISVPDGFISGSLISGSSTYSGETFATLGMTPGNYVWTLPNDTITLNIQATVPVPASVWLFGSALGILSWMRRKKARTTYLVER